MSKKIYLLLILFSFALQSCQEDIPCITDVSLEIESAQVEGLIRANMFYNGGETTPFITIPYTNNSNTEIILEAKNIYGNSSPITICVTSTTLATGEGTLQIPIYGSVDNSDENIEIEFNIFLNESQGWNVVMSDIVVYDEDYQLPDFEFSIDMQASIMNDLDVRVNDDNKQCLELTYCNGYYRTANFTVTIENNEGIIIDNLSDYVLENDGEQHTITFDVSGRYTGDLSSLNITVDAELDDQTTAQATTNTPVIDGETLTITSLEFKGDLEQNVNNTGYYQDTLYVNYSYGEGRDVTMLLNITNGEGITYSVDTPYTLDFESGIIPIIIGGTPTNSGTANFEVSISGNATTTAVTKDLDVNISPASGDINIASITITGPIFSSVDFSEDYILSVNYSEGTVGKQIEIIDIISSLNVDKELFATKNIYTLTQTSGTITINLGTDIFASTILESEMISIPTDARTMQVSMNYNSNQDLQLNTQSFTLEGFVFNNCTYKPKTVGSTVWLDRNIGATSIDVMMPEVSSSGTLSQGNSNYTPNFKAFGHFFQSGRATGIPLVIGEQSPLAVYDASYADVPYFKSVSYHGGSWDDGNWEYPTNAFLEELNWQGNNGGVNNPCPTGYRVPYKEELTTMVSDVKSMSSYSTSLAALISEMNFEPSGYINYNGPSVVGTGTVVGQTNSVGLHGNGTGTTIGAINDVSVCYINLASCEISGSTATNCFIQYLRVQSTNTTGTAGGNRGLTMPVRCIQQ